MPVILSIPSASSCRHVPCVVHSAPLSYPEFIRQSPPAQATWAMPDVTDVSLRELQALIRGMYHDKDVARGIDGTFMWLMEEVGELAAALREGTPQSRPPSSPTCSPGSRLSPTSRASISPPPWATSTAPAAPGAATSSAPATTPKNRDAARPPRRLQGATAGSSSSAKLVHGINRIIARTHSRCTESSSRPAQRPSHRRRPPRFQRQLQARLLDPAPSRHRGRPDRRQRDGRSHCTRHRRRADHGVRRVRRPDHRQNARHDRGHALHPRRPGRRPAHGATRRRRGRTLAARTFFPAPSRPKTKSPWACPPRTGW